MAPGFSRRVLSANETMVTRSALAYIDVDPSKQEEVTLEFTLPQISHIAKALRKGESIFDLGSVEQKYDQSEDLSRPDFDLIL